MGKRAAVKKPVRLHSGASKFFVAEIFTDASAWGWGAVSIWEGRVVSTASHPWTPEERMNWRVESSVVAEPLAVVKAVAKFLPARRAECPAGVRIWSDHLPLVFAAARGVGKAFAYSHMLSALSHREGYFFCFGFVAGENNPADPFSRGRTLQHTPPLLPVTRIGRMMRWEGEREAKG